MLHQATRDRDDQGRIVATGARLADAFAELALVI